ncbi:MAG: hypothetical protein BWY66_01175 [bacterium ADurb.Bin374]|nr:MAG: hypothetical protein BWY66_01175 [bacterium ADurb.Bin374]
MPSALQPRCVKVSVVVPVESLSSGVPAEVFIGSLNVTVNTPEPAFMREIVCGAIETSAGAMVSNTSWLVPLEKPRASVVLRRFRS